jgi:hypothetical protein
VGFVVHGVAATRLFFDFPCQLPIHHRLMHIFNHPMVEAISLIAKLVVKRSRSHITTDGQSASSSWCLDPFGAGDHMLHLFE